jgi:V/A-type H+-transporting ATPase subunit I
MQALQDERDFLENRIQDIQPWGDFSYPPQNALRGLRLWFYIVPLNDMRKVRSSGLTWQLVARDNRFAYVVVVSEAEPSGMPVPRTRTGNRSLSDLELRLEEVMLALEDLQAERASLTRWCHLYAASLSELEDQEALVLATSMTFDASPLFALQAWAPTDVVPQLRAYAQEKGLALDVRKPHRQETPPTLLQNRPRLASGQDLVSFYMTPNYWLWDPSTVVFFSFSLFFAMILSDGGYALIMGLGLAVGWRKLGRSDTGSRLRLLFASLVGSSFAWGVMVGSYFGGAPTEGTILSRMHILEMNDYDAMMQMSVFIGIGHLVLSNLADARRRGFSTDAMAPLGWIAQFVGAVMIWHGMSTAGASLWLKNMGIAVMVLGGLLVVFFSGVEGPLWKRPLSGLLALTNITNAFGDALSYLRLFALGLASASLAMAFNDLAHQVREILPGFGILFALLVFVIGHSLNFVLAVVSGFIHGLRLNFIEFFNWSIPEEGRPFRAFARKETTVWNR